ncbi:MAG: dockerin type I domain-containing protein [Elusimicrobiota bacterium]
MRPPLLILLLLSVFPAPATAMPNEDWVELIMTSTMTLEVVKRFYAPEMQKIEGERLRTAESRARHFLPRNSRTTVAAGRRNISVPLPVLRIFEHSKGGRLRRSDNAAMRVPASALSQSADLFIAHPDDDPVREGAAARKRLLHASLPVGFGPEGTRFNSSVTITVPYDPELVETQGLKETDLQVHYWNPQARTWEALSSRVNTADKTVGADVLHLSIYQVLAPGGAGTVAAPTDINGDGVTDASDVQLVIDQARGRSACTTGDINKDGACNVADIQMIVIKTLGKK